MRGPAAWPLPWRIAAAAILGRLQAGGEAEVRPGHVGCALGVNHRVVEAVLRRLEAAGLIHQTATGRYVLASAERARAFLQDLREAAPPGLPRSRAAVSPRRETRLRRERLAAFVAASRPVHERRTARSQGL